MQISEKNKKPNTSIPLVSYEASIENGDLRLFVAVAWVESSSIEKITEQQILSCIQNRRHRLLDGKRLYLINEALKPFAM